MTENNDKDGLAGLRRQIDAIDDQIADLIVERMAVVDDIRACKQREAISSRSAMRPGREAEIVRRIVRRAGAAMPAPAIARIWREMISAATRAQSPFTVHCANSSGQWACAMVARDHFGVLTPLVWHSTVSDALAAVVANPADVAVVAVLYDYDDINEPPWWALAGAQLGSAFHIIALLDDEANELLQVAVAASEPEPSGEDVSYVVAEGIAGGKGDDDLQVALADAGLNGKFIAASAFDGVRQIMTEVEGFIATGDDRLRRAAADPRLSRVARAGAAARLMYKKGQSS